MEFQVLGPLEIRRPGGSVPLGGPRQRRLLALLLLDGGAVVPTGRLVSRLWDRPPETAKPQVHNTVAALRRTLSAHGGDGRLDTTDVGYRIRVAREELDLCRFGDRVADARDAEERGEPDKAALLLQGALDEWRGPALAGLGGTAVRAAAAALDHQRLDATDRLLRLQVDLGRHDEVVGPLAELAAAHPLRESLNATLMRALDRAGRRSEALQAYERLSHRLAEQGITPGAELRELRDRVVRGDRHLAPAASARAPAPPEDDLPSFLPYGTREFTGRAAEIDVLSAEAARPSPTGPTIVTIEGMGGVGKTALALHAGHRLGTAYPDGQYFVDLHGFTHGQQALDPAAALDLLLRASGLPPERIQPDLTTRAAQWRARIAGKRVIVVLDNALDADQVRPLIPGSPGCLVLVTSRRHLSALDSAVPVPLSVLPDDEAKTLFRRVAGLPDQLADAGEESALGTAARLCGRLPLAIRIAASRLRQRPHWKIGDLAGMLADQHRRARLLTTADRDVHTALTVSHHQLPEDSRRLFRLLGVHPGNDFDVAAVAALAGVPVTEAEHELEKLFESHLLLQHAADRYQLHDLVRDFARLRLAEDGSEAEADAARHRLFDHYLLLAYDYCLPMARGFSRIEPTVRHTSRLASPAGSESEAMDRLRRELDNLVAIARYAGEHGWDAHAWQLPCLLLPFFARINYREHLLEIFENAAKSARRLDDPHGQTVCLINIARLLRHSGRYEHAHGLLDQAADITRATGDERTEAYVLANVGITCLRTGELTRAEAAFTKAHAIAVRLGDRMATAAFTNNLGVVSVRLGRPGEGLDRFPVALALYQELHFRQGEAFSHLSAGEAHLAAGRPTAAAPSLGRALATSTEIGYKLGEGLALAWLGDAHRALGNLDVATGYAEAALEVGQETGLSEVECDALNCLGEIRLARPSADLAAAQFSAAETLATARNLPRALGRARDGLAHVALLRGDHLEADRQWELALAAYPPEIADSAGVHDHLEGLGRFPVRCRRC